MKKTAVIFESFEGIIRNASWEALTCATELSTGEGSDIELVLIDNNPDTLASEISKISGRKVIAIDTGGSYNADTTKSILAELFTEQSFAHVCLAGTTQGLDYAPGLSVRLRKPCFTGVEKVSLEDSVPYLSRSTYGGKIMEKCPISETGAVIVTQPGTFKPFSDEGSATANVDLRSDTTRSETIYNIEVRQVQKESSALAEASIIVAAGRGIKEEENLELIQQLAGVFAKSAIGGSRPLCDLEWLEYKQQVGITGATVTPDLYLACGISGAAQHISGMRNAGYIVAVNIDPKAAIFNFSDVCIVEDLTTFIPIFIETFEQLKQN